jgi:hypothetical protein
MRRCLWLLGLLAAGGCDRANVGTAESTAEMAGAELVPRAEVERVLTDAAGRIAERADSVDRLFRPVPLLTPAQEASLRRSTNAQHLERGTSLGVRPANAAERNAAVAAGRLVLLPDTSRYWVVRELTHSEPLLTPDAQALLEEIGRRFHARLERLGAPPFRLEVTSVLRTAESQAELRRTNPNAAAGQSTHEYGTTLDVAYASFAAPADVDVEGAVDALPWLRPWLRSVAAARLETVAARNSRELQAILGLVMIEVQNEGLALVTLERQQPVYHFTVARRMRQ